LVSKGGKTAADAARLLASNENLPILATDPRNSKVSACCGRQKSNWSKARA